MSNINHIKDAYRNGDSYAKIARDTGFDVKTVKKYIMQEDFSPKLPSVVSRSTILDPYKEIINSWLESDKDSWHKQRYTAMKVYKDLVKKEGYTGSYPTIQRYVKKWRQENSQVKAFQDLIWYPGQAQVDCGEADFIVNGMRRRKLYLTMTFPYSNLSQIFIEAFSFKAAAGGVAGSVIVMAMRNGIARGLYSNEAGEGSAPVIHAAAEVEHPVDQGLAGIVEVFIDTFVICTITALVLGVTGAHQLSVPGNVLVIEAFATVYDPLRYLVIVSLLLFSTTTLMSQWYFGFVGLHYIFGESIADKFKYVFPFFCVFGALLRIELVWIIQDIALGFLTIPNLLALIILFPEVRRISLSYVPASSNHFDRNSA